MRALATLAITVCLVGACKKDDAPKAVAISGSGSGSGSAARAGSGDALTADRLASAEALWAAHQAAHVGATTANVIETGRKIWPLLGNEAHMLVLEVSQKMTAQLGVKVPISAQELAYKVLGETAAARAQAIAAAQVSAVQMVHDGSAKLEVRTGKDTLKFEAVRERGGWLLAPSESLVSSDTEVFHAPAGSEAPQGSATLEQLSQRWRDAMTKGTGWDAYNMLSPANRVKLDALIAQMGGSGAEDVAKVLEKTIKDRRDRGIAVDQATIEDRTAERATIVLTYSNGKGDRFPAVHADGAWWLEMPL